MIIHWKNKNNWVKDVRAGNRTWPVYQSEQKNDARTFRPLATMIVEKAKLMHMDHVRSVASIEEIICMGWGLELSILRQLLTAVWREILCCWSNRFELNGHSEEFRMWFLRWQEIVNVNYEQINFLRPLGSNWNLFWRMFMTTQSYKPQKSRQLSFLWPARWVIKVSNNNSS